MNTFPTNIPIAKSSRRISRDGRDEDERSDGVMDVVKTHPDKFDFTIDTGWLNSSMMTTLLTFLAANTGSFILVWPEDGVSYTVAQGKGALSTQWLSANVRTASLRFVGQ